MLNNGVNAVKIYAHVQFNNIVPPLPKFQEAMTNVMKLLSYELVIIWDLFPDDVCLHTWPSNILWLCMFTPYVTAVITFENKASTAH